MMLRCSIGITKRKALLKKGYDVAIRSWEILVNVAFKLCLIQEQLLVLVVIALEGYFLGISFEFSNGKCILVLSYT
jgi:hypothetical protein